MKFRFLYIIGILVLTVLTMTSLSVEAVPVTFSFTRYSGPTYQEVSDTTGFENISYGFVNEGILPIEPSIDKELVYSITTPDNSYTIEAWESFGSQSIPESPSEISFNTSTDGYTPMANLFSFVPAENTEVDKDIPVYLGTFTFTNGDWFLASAGAFFDFNITATSETADLQDQLFQGTINLISNPNMLDTPEARADWFSIVGRPDLGSVRVFDAGDGMSTGSVEFWGVFGSLDLYEFRNPTGGAFLNTSTTPDLAPVPEPSTMILFGAGLAGLAAVGRGRRKK